MSSHKIISPQTMFFIKDYEYTYTALSKRSRVELTRSNFGITDIPGYTPICIRKYSGGTGAVSVYFVTPDSNVATGNDNIVMGIYHNATSAMSNDKKAYIQIVWMKSEYVSEEL